MADGGNAPSWLFSFVDLAFLLLIAMTQLADDTAGPDLGDIIVPRLESAEARTMPGVQQAWQLRVHPPGEAPPFELSRGGPTAPGSATAARLALDALHERLDAIRQDGGRKPLLAPHEDSRSQDLLDAVAALERHWPGNRRAAVAPLAANP